jgi:hypothetical protein
MRLCTRCDRKHYARGLCKPHYRKLKDRYPCSNVKWTDEMLEELRYLVLVCGLKHPTIAEELKVPVASVRGACQKYRILQQHHRANECFLRHAHLPVAVIAQKCKVQERTVRDRLRALGFRPLTWGATRKAAPWKLVAAEG